MFSMNIQGVIHKIKRRTQEEGRRGQEEADMGGGQAKVNVHIWFKIYVFDCPITGRIMNAKSIDTYSTVRPLLSAVLRRTEF